MYVSFTLYLRKRTSIRAGSGLFKAIIAALTFSLCAACGGAPTPVPTPTPPPLADELILYNWAEYMPQSVLEAFTEAYGVRVVYEAYESQEDAADNIQAGRIYDVAVLPPEQIPSLIAAGALAEINFRNIPNFKNVSANFRDLAFDPGNRHSIPFHWGTTGLLVRTDLVKEPVTRWADLWNPKFAGKVALWPVSRDLIPIALKSLGYRADSDRPAELEAALQALLKLKPNAFFIGNDNATVVPVLARGEAVIAYGWAYDALVAQEENAPIQYILPEEGTFLWGDNFVIPANSSRQYTAEVFLNFLLRPEISAQIINESYYPMANDAARPFVNPDILNNPVVYPPEADLKDAQIIMPLSGEGEYLFRDIWQRFMSAEP